LVRVFLPGKWARDEPFGREATTIKSEISGEAVYAPTKVSSEARDPYQGTPPDVKVKIARKQSFPLNESWP
jgi:hypothetical protein